MANILTGNNSTLQGQTEGKGKQLVCYKHNKIIHNDHCSVLFTAPFFSVYLIIFLYDSSYDIFR